MSEKEQILKKLAQAIIDYDKEAALAAAKEAVETGVNPVETIENGLSVGLKEVGERFSRAEYPLPFMMLAADAMTTCVDYLRGFIAKEDMPKPIGTYVIGTVAGDIHDIGVKIVAPLLEVAGFKVHDIGVDVSVEKFIEAAEKVGADIIGVSSFLTSTMLELRRLVKALERRGLREKYKIMVGGGAVSEAWCEEAGADAYAPDATSAATKAKGLIEAQ
jgi:5-methyltetrahydrofolate--homocysteine methyltransferase